MDTPTPPPGPVTESQSAEGVGGFTNHAKQLYISIEYIPRNGWRWRVSSVDRRTLAKGGDYTSRHEAIFRLVVWFVRARFNPY
jgi:hypothetical protein